MSPEPARGTGGAPRIAGTAATGSTCAPTKCSPGAQGEEVEKDQKLFTLEAMKMETTVYAERPRRVAEVLVKPGTLV